MNRARAQYEARNARGRREVAEEKTASFTLAELN